MTEQKYKKISSEPELATIPLETEDFGEIFGGWEIPEFIKPERKTKWYFFFIIVVIALFIYSYFDKNPLFALIIFLSLAIFFVHEKRGPGNVSFVVAEDGIIIGKKFIEYKDLENFYIIYYLPKIKNLYFQPKNNFKPLIIIPLLDQNPVDVRKVLLEYLDEDLDKE